MDAKDVFACRGVRRMPGFDEAAKKIFGSDEKADEAFEGLEFALGRNPHQSSTFVAKTNGDVDLYAIKTRNSELSRRTGISFDVLRTWRSTVDPTVEGMERIRKAIQGHGP